VVPVREYDVFFPQTVIVNRTYEFRNYGYAVNPGIAPTVVAAFAGRPVHLSMSLLLFLPEWSRRVSPELSESGAGTAHRTDQ
jgi:hypothetical protein